MIAWLGGMTLFSFVAAFVVDRIFAALVAEATATTVAARNTLFVGIWTAVTTGTGMRSFTKTVRRLRLKGLGAKNKIDALTKNERR